MTSNSIANAANRAFSLSEVAIAVAIVSFTLLPMIAILGLVSNSEGKIKDNELLLKFVDDLTQILHQESNSPVKFIWHFPDSSNPPLTIAYPQNGTGQTEFYLVADGRGQIVRSVSRGVFQIGDRNAAIEEVYLLKGTLKYDRSSAVSQMVDDPAMILELSIESPVNIATEDRSKDQFTSRIY